MQFKTRITQKDYVSLMFVLTYKKGWLKFITLVGILMLLISFAYFIGQASKIVDADYTPWPNILMGTLFVFGTPLFTYLSAKRNYKSIQRLHEETEYEFTEEAMILSGNSFNSELKWNGTYKIEELKKWFLIYQSRQSVIPISKKDLTPGQIKELRHLFKSLNGIKVRLK